MASNLSKILIKSCLPSRVQVVSGAIGAFQGKLYEDEYLYIRHAVPQRVREFTAGRTCARKALSQLGYAEACIPAGCARQPLWPERVTGSITHDGNFCVAAAAETKWISSLGIDLAPCAVLDSELIDLVCLPEELDWIGNYRGLWSQIDPFMLVFSLKEAIFKCMFPLVHEIFDFHDVAIYVRPGSSSPFITLKKSKLFSNFDAALASSYCITGDHIFSAVWINV